MSVICLICKDKLLNNAPGNQLGSLNSLSENQVVATGCGHLYHFECLQCWFRTQKKKLHNQGITGNFSDQCPTCQVEVQDHQTRAIYLLEDHRESLERAKLLESFENLEIYCYQLETHIHQLQRDNDLLVDKALAPQSSSRTDDFAAIVKNDKVMWLKKDNTPLSAVVLTIFKKDGALWVKIKLDKKNRTNQRSGLFGSFRFDKKQELTVPFEEIVLEKEYKKNNIVNENELISEPSCPAVALQQSQSFRNSTLSLPGEYLNSFPGRSAKDLYPALNRIYNYGSTIELSRPISEVAEEQAPTEQRCNTEVKQTCENRLTMPCSNDDVTSNKNRIGQCRDYVVLNTPLRSPKLDGGRNRDMFASTPQLNDIKPKHVTFADDLLMEKRLSVTSSIFHFRDHDYKNVIEMSQNLERARNQIKEENGGYLGNEMGVNNSTKLYYNDDLANLSPSHNEPSTPSTPHSASSTVGELQTDIFIDSLNQSSPQLSPRLHYNKSCFDITFSMLFYECNVFDKLLLNHKASNDDIQQRVQSILRQEFIIPLRNSKEKKYTAGYSDRLHELISHLCSAHLDLEELMTILFEYVFKILPFICYSYDMCDYIHQFFIDFTDKEKTPTVQHLLQKSLLLQDNLKLRGEPSPCLFLQMPNSEDGLIIHYDAVLPSLTLNIEDLLESDAIKSDALSCYCNKIATLECATCTQIHGRSPILFCDECSVLLEAIHDSMYHKLNLVPINTTIRNSSSTLTLAGVICLKGNTYSLFLRRLNVDDTNDKLKWTYLEDFEDGSPKVIELPKLDEWIETQCSNPTKLDIASFSKYQRKLLTECRMFVYLPTQNSFA